MYARVCLSHRLSGCAVHLAVRCVWWPAVGAGVRGQSAVWDRTLSRGHRQSRTLLQQRKHTRHRAQAHTARRHTRPVRDGKRMKLDSGGGRKNLNGFINFTVESTHTHSSLALTPLSVCLAASLCSWWKNIKNKNRQSSEVCKNKHALYIKVHILIQMHTYEYNLIWRHTRIDPHVQEQWWDQRTLMFSFPFIFLLTSYFLWSCKAHK